MRKYTIFFTWQSDRKDVKKIIERKLREIKDNLEKYDTCLILDHDTRERVGTENIEQTVLEKIAACDIFVADITPVTFLEPRKKGAHIKLLPNSNVMYEYGYAKGIGKINRCILLANLAEGENKEDLPFDINHDTITEFKTAEDLGGLKGWILNIIEKVDKEREEVTSSINASVHFSGFEDEITINPQFVEYHYVPRSHQKVPATNELAAQTVVKSLLSSTKLLQAHIDKIKAPIEQVKLVKPVSKTTYLDRCPLSFIISNDSDNPLENCKVYVSCKNQEVHFYDSNVEERLSLKIRSLNDIDVTDDVVFWHRQIINPHEKLPIGVVFITIPYGLAEITLDWHISSAQGNGYGQLMLKVNPVVDYDTVENDCLAWDTRVVGKVIKE